MNQHQALYLSSDKNQVHELKVVKPYFAMIEDGRKPFELRKNDRNYKTGDLLILREYVPDQNEYTGYTLVATVTCVVKGEWLAPDHVALGIRVLD